MKGINSFGKFDYGIYQDQKVSDSKLFDAEFFPDSFNSLERVLLLLLSWNC